jgi:flagellar export protein FliJ
MKRFVFALETLLRYRRNLEEKERNELSRLFFRYHREKQSLASLQSKHGDAMMELTQKRTGEVDPREIEWSCLYLKRLEFEMEECRKRIHQLEKEIEIQKKAVIEATKKTKILDTLKSHKRQDYLAAYDKEEQKTVDEIVVTRFARRESQIS